MKYVKCSNCGKKIQVGSYGFGCQNMNAVYCSKQCFADAYGDQIFINNSNIELNDYNVIDDEEVLSEKEQLKEQIKTLQIKLEKLEKEVPDEPEASS